MDSSEKTCKINSLSFRLRNRSLNSIRLRRTFDAFDRNGDGLITVAELNEALSLLGLTATELSDLNSIISPFITNNNALTFEDFDNLHSTLNKVYFNQEDDEGVAEDDDQDLEAAFKVFDEDGDGFISARELQVVLGKLGMKEGGEIERVEMMITSVDKNHDGVVDFLEFKDMMRSVITVPS